MVCEASPEEITEYLQRRGGGSGGGRSERPIPPTSSIPNSASNLPPGQMTKSHRSVGQLHDQQPGQVSESNNS